jgi:tRNA-specific 2-thiouridylase
MSTTGNEKVLAALSGGVDSAVSALLLKREGYDVTGINLRLYALPELCDGRAKSCCSPEDARDARMVAMKLSLPFFTIRMEREFEERVIRTFIDEYRSGRTPNPCVECNTFIKFGTLFEKGAALGFRKIATGHYARLVHLENGRYSVREGRDAGKNQAYYLYGLSQRALESVLFPLGDLTKVEVRRIAASEALPVAKKAESQEICFVPDNDYRSFLEASGVQFTPGFFRNTGGEILGRHEGRERYTVGQRKGLGLAHRVPYYVLRVESDGDVIVGEADETLRRTFTVSSLHFQGLDPETFFERYGDQSFECRVQIRYRSVPVPARIRSTGKSSPSSVLVELAEGVSSIAPGQSAVFYPDKPFYGYDDIVLAGGVIESIQS